MSRTINDVTYALQGTTENSATFGAIISNIPTTVRFQTLATRQGGLEGFRVTRTVTQKITMPNGTVATVSESHSSFLPDCAAITDSAACRVILRSLMAETGYDAALAAMSIE